jgi:hypothetical protein
VDADPSSNPQGTITEETEGDASAPTDELTISSTTNGGASDDTEKPAGDEDKLPTPTTVVVPPSPTQSERNMSSQLDGSDD